MHFIALDVDTERSPPDPSSALARSCSHERLKDGRLEFVAHFLAPCPEHVLRAVFWQRGFDLLRSTEGEQIGKVTETFGYEGQPTGARDTTASRSIVRINHRLRDTRTSPQCHASTSRGRTSARSVHRVSRSAHVGVENLRTRGRTVVPREDPIDSYLSLPEHSRLVTRSIRNRLPIVVPRQKYLSHDPHDNHTSHRNLRSFTDTRWLREACQSPGGERIQQLLVARITPSARGPPHGGDNLLQSARKMRVFLDTAFVRARQKHGGTEK